MFNLKVLVVVLLLVLDLCDGYTHFTASLSHQHFRKTTTTTTTSHLIPYSTQLRVKEDNRSSRIPSNRDINVQPKVQTARGIISRIKKKQDLEQNQTIQPSKTPPIRGVVPTTVEIIRPSSRTRTIKGSITIPIPSDSVWGILTDYNRLATHVKNLVESRVLEEEGISEEDEFTVGENKNRRLKIYQKGAQRIAGFSFGASLILEMQEENATGELNGGVQKILFKCIDSQFFNNFDGTWTVTPLQGVTTVNGGPVLSGGATRVDYEVFIKPRGPVPVQALEWRIREDVPSNLQSVADAAIKLFYEIRKLRVDNNSGEKPATATETTETTKKAEIVSSTTPSAPRLIDPSSPVDPITRLAMLVNPGAYNAANPDVIQDEGGEVKEFMQAFKPRQYQDYKQQQRQQEQERQRLVSDEDHGNKRRRRRRFGKLVDLDQRRRETLGSINDDNDPRDVFNT